MTYTGRLEDDGVDVVCSAVQTDLYSGSISTRMGVSAAAVPGPAIPVGGIIGIVLGVLFLLFLCAVLLLLFLCWDKIKYKKKVRGGGSYYSISTLFYPRSRNKNQFGPENPPPHRSIKKSIPTRLFLSQ